MMHFAPITHSVTTTNGTNLSIDDFLEGIDSYLTNARFQFKLSREDAEDLRQDAAVDLLVRINKFDAKRSSAKSFGYMVARNWHYDCYHSAKNRELPVSSLMPNEDSEKLDYFYTIVCAEEGTPESRYCDEEESREEGPVWKALRQLKEEDREMMLMLANDLKPREIAEEVGMDPRVVHTRLCRAKKKLQRILKNVA